LAKDIAPSPPAPGDQSRRSPRLRRVPPRYGGRRGDILRRLTTDGPEGEEAD